jgi:hypothetical protein
MVTFKRKTHQQGRICVLLPFKLRLRSFVAWLDITPPPRDEFCQCRCPPMSETRDVNNIGALHLIRHSSALHIRIQFAETCLLLRYYISVYIISLLHFRNQQTDVFCPRSAKVEQYHSIEWRTDACSRPCAVATAWKFSSISTADIISAII